MKGVRGFKTIIRSIQMETNMSVSRFVPIAAVGLALPVASITRLFATVSEFKRSDLLIPEDINDTFKLSNDAYLRIEIFATVTGEKKSVDHLVNTIDIACGEPEVISVEENLKNLFNALELEKPERREIRYSIERYHTFARKKQRAINASGSSLPVIKEEAGGTVIEGQVITADVPEWTEKNERNQEKRIETIRALTGESEATIIEQENWTPEIILEVENALGLTINKLGL